jgi:hypothetical protein
MRSTPARDKWQKLIQAIRPATFLSKDLDQWTCLKGETINEERLSRVLDGIEPTRGLRLELCRFTFPLDLKQLGRLREVALVDCVFEELVSGDGMRFERPWFVCRCEFVKSLALAEAEFCAGLSLLGCWFGFKSNYEGGADHRGSAGPHASAESFAEYHEAPNRATTAWWPGLRVKGVFRLDRSCFAGSVNLSESRIEGPLLMRGIQVGQERREVPVGAESRIAADSSRRMRPRGRLFLRQIRVQGDIDLSPHVPHRDWSQAVPTFVNGSVILAASDVEGSIDFRGARVMHRFHLPLAHIRDRLSGEAWLHPSDEDHRHILQTVILGRDRVALCMPDAVIDHGVWLDGIRMAGQLDAKNVKVGGDFLLRQARDRYRRPINRGCRIWLERPGHADGPLNRRIVEAVRLLGARIGGSVEFDWADVLGEMNLENIQVGCDVLMRGAKISPLPAPEGMRSIVSGIQSPLLRLRMARVNRTIDLRGSQFDGCIDAHGCEARGDLYCGAWQRDSYYEEWGVRRGLQNLAMLPEPGRTAWQGGWYGGDLDLTNATVAGETTFCGGIFEGKISAQGIKVGHVCDFSGGVFRHEVDFDDAEIRGELMLGCHCDNQLRGAQGTKVWTEAGTFFTAGLTLRRTEIRGDFLYANAYFGFSVALDWEHPEKYARQGLVPRPWSTEEKPAFWEPCKKNGPDAIEPPIVLNLRLATIEGAILPPRQQSGNTKPPASCRYGACAGTLNATNVAVKGDVRIEYFYINGGLVFEGADVGGDFLLRGTCVVGDLNAKGVKIAGEAFTRASDTDHRAIKTFYESNPPYPELAHRRCAPDVSGELQLQQARIEELTLVLHAHTPLEKEETHSLSGQAQHRRCAVGKWIPWGAENFWSGAREPRSSGPITVVLQHAEIGKLRVSGNLPFEREPTFSMEGLRFQELSVEGLTSGKECLGSGWPAGLTWQGAWRRDFYHRPWRSLMGFPLFAPACAFLRKIAGQAWWELPPGLRRLMTAASEAVYRIVFGRSRPKERPRIGKGPIWYPRGVLLFLRQMPKFDAGLYARTENWLRDRGQREESEQVYIERRLQETESGFIAWLWHRGKTLHHLGSRTNEERLRNFLAATEEGRPAFQNPIAIEHSIRAFWNKRGLPESELSKPWDDHQNFWRELKEQAWRELSHRLSRVHNRWWNRVLLAGVGQGVRPAPVLGLLVGLFLFSTFCVFSDPASVEHPATYVVPRTNGGREENVPPLSEVPTWSDSSGSARELPAVSGQRTWNFLDGAWVALNAHVPLVNLVARDDWRPSGEPIKFFLDGWFGWRVRADTWAGMMQVLGWICVPVLLSAVTGLLKKR